MLRIIVALCVILAIVILYLVCRGGNDGTPEAAIKQNICHQKEEHVVKDFVVENNLNDLRIGDNFTDVEVVSQNVILRAHKVILASHSKYFDTIIWSKLQSQNASSGDSRHTSIDITFADHKTIANVLHFMYSGFLSNEVFDSEIEYTNFMLAAAELQMDGLKCEISKRLSIRINKKNVASLVVISEEADAQYLMILSSNYLLDNFREVSETSEWQAIAKAHRNVLTNAIDFHGKLPANSTCDIQCQPATVLSPSIFMRLRRFFITQRYADASIRVTNGEDDKTFYVNRAILAAQSKVFQQQFDQFPKTIVLNDTSSAVMEEFLNYMYSGWPSQLKKFTEGLLYLSETYGMVPLKNACEDTIIDELNVQNAAKIVEIANKANSKRLSSVVLDFILKNRKEIVTTKTWSELKQKNPELLTKIFSS